MGNKLTAETQRTRRNKIVTVNNSVLSLIGMFTPFVVSLSNHEKKPFDKLRANGKNSLSQKYLQQHKILKIFSPRPLRLCG
jgi:hypothetical protein